MAEIPKAYEPQAVEDKWYQFWLDQKCFVADPARVSDQRPAYSIVIPPPNVTGMLHMGHVLNNTIQDILSRKARMEGKEVLWLPGTDHAGIATEGMVAKQIWKEEKKSKRDLGREEFIKRVWAWKEKHGGIIIEQLKKLGCSCDWTRERFTMDEHYVRCVQKVFVELYKKGLIYRGKRMVNWCPATQTALSDEEVEMKPQKGFMYHFKVEVAEAPDIWLTIATTRPETIPGDTAVAVNPKDTRYAHLIGKHIVRPLPPELPREQKLIPIIDDDHVDFEFGTGVLKVTPAHDKADFEIWARARIHGIRRNIDELRNMQPIDIMNSDATMNELAGADLKGLDRFKARKVAVEKLTELAALVDEKPYENNVGFSQRADVPIEPRLSEQWFLKYPAVEQSRACAEMGDPGGSLVPPNKMRFHPQRWARVYDHWLTNIQDWCISRQLWWGHRIPVWSQTESDAIGWQKMLPPEVEARIPVTTDLQTSPGFEYSLSKQPGHITVFQSYGLLGRKSGVFASTLSPLEEAKLKEFGFTQDPDVLDTWFSSWLWPFATMGWTDDKTQDSKNATLQAFYPTTDLVTGPDIIFFWVARMIMAGYEFMGDRPFHNVYFTGIIRDKLGRKMSKTLGNSPDPLELISKYGADALRFGTMRSAPLGQDVLFDEQDVELGRNFCNKLWNACRFRQMVGSAESPIEGEIEPRLLTSDDKWILLRLDRAITEVTAALNEYKFSEAAQVLYRFFWSEFCDWYLEASKAVLTRPPIETISPHLTLPSPPLRGGEGMRDNTLAVIDFILSNTLRLFHPFLPFITEELWHGLGYTRELPADQGGNTIMTARWPKPLGDDFKAHYGLDESDERLAQMKYDLVTQGRNLRREGNIASSKKVKFVFKPANPLPQGEAEVLKILLNAESLEVDPKYQPKKGTPTALSPLGELYLPLEGLIDVAAEKARLTKELAKIESEIEKVQAKLSNPNFTQKVPPPVLEEHQKRLADWQAKNQQVQAMFDSLG